MTEVERQRWMKVFGYSQEWFDAGLISPQGLQRQIAEWEQSDADHHPEHYRYSTWRKYLDTLVEIPVELLDVLLSLDLQEAGLADSSVSSFGHGIAHDLAKQPALTLEGLARLRRHWTMRTRTLPRAPGISARQRLTRDRTSVKGSRRRADALRFGARALAHVSGRDVEVGRAQRGRIARLGRTCPADAHRWRRTPSGPRRRCSSRNRRRASAACARAPRARVAARRTEAALRQAVVLL